MNREVYESFDLTVAQHPSETAERMMARLLAYCINYQEHLIFSKGLSTPDEPDIWAHGLDGQILSWIDVGEPSPERIKKASRICKSVKVYSFNSKSNVWWDQGMKALASYKADYFRFSWEEIQTLAQLLERTMELSISITDDSAYIASSLGNYEVNWQLLNPSI
jgi:uncharacterized protein YaeQ